jgi:hypothetical protein
MNEKLQKHLSTLENLIGIQKGCILPGDSSVQYMHGMLNGIILAHAVISESNPKFFNMPKRHNSIRHKSVIKKGKL